jgi:hypothetical protein
VPLLGELLDRYKILLGKEPLVKEPLVKELVKEPPLFTFDYIIDFKQEIEYFYRKLQIMLEVPASTLIDTGTTGYTMHLSNLKNRASPQV